jgi:hypothetical protein
MDWYRSKNRNKSKAGLPGDTETGGTRFASIAFGYPNALWGEPQSPVTEHERRSNMWNFIIGAMFGGMCGVGIVCLTVIGKQADEDMEHIEKKKETSALEGKVFE